MTLHRTLALVCCVVLVLCCNLALSQREKPSKRIDSATWDTTISKFESTLNGFEQAKVPHDLRTLVIFHIGDLARPMDSIDIILNNVKIFLHAVELHSETSKHKAFYLFNVIDQHNPIIDTIPTKRPNVGLLRWTMASSDLDAHLRTLRILGRNITDRFGAIIFANQGVRGPLIKRKNGEWIGEFRNLLGSNNVGLVGPTMSCEVSPHVQTHMFSLKTDVIPIVLSQMRQNITAHFTSWQEVIAALEVGLTGVVMRAGYNVSSFLYNNRGQPYFEHGKCLTYTGPPNRFDKNPVGWCGVTPNEQVFIKWGGEPMRTRGMICNDTVLHMEDTLLGLAAAEPGLQLTIPEALMGGMLFPLFKEYIAETWMDRSPVPAPQRTGTAKKVPKVCFVVRVLDLPQDRMRHANPYSRLMNKDIHLLVATLKRQTNPNWSALFVRVDSAPLEAELRNTLLSFADPRLELFAQTHAPPYDTDDAGYKAVDAALHQLLQRKECQWISVTTSDNAYGSEVVERILSTGVQGMINAPNLLLAPMDSRRFLDQDLHYNKKMAYLGIIQEDYCSFLPSLEQSGFTNAFRPTPVVGRVDLASAFFSAELLGKENVAFDNFSDKRKFPCEYNITDPVGYKCLNNQGAYLVHHLVQRRLWSYARLPIDGLRSVVFHGNSPTLCIAAGDVWIDSVWNGRIDPTMQMCITPKDALSISPEIAFDMVHFFQQDMIVGTCFRARNPDPVVVDHFFKPY